MESTGTMGGKPVFEIPSKTIINMDSGFKHKLLCDCPIFSTGTACQYSCGFCYVSALMQKETRVQAIKESTGNSLEKVVIRRKVALAIIRRQLTTGKGIPRFADPSDTRVIYASPLVDVAANMELDRETIEACKIILELTNWQIRLLSKSNLLPKVAAALDSHRDRLIFGVSTGTLDDAVARVFEEGTALVSKRIKSLHELQDSGFRTFGMACPSLPQAKLEAGQLDHPAYLAFGAAVAERVRVDKCEHVWGEVLNVRGASLTRTVNGLLDGGFSSQAELLNEDGTDVEVWEDYARATFVGLSKSVPAEKLRFLQYVTPKSVAWWKEHEPLGAVLLGKAAEASV